MAFDQLTNISIANGTVSLEAGVYLVSYYANGSATTFDVTLNLNGTPISTIEIVPTTTDSSSKTLIVNAPTDGSTLTLTNTGSNFDVVDVGLTVLRLS